MPRQYIPTRGLVFALVLAAALLAYGSTVAADLPGDIDGDGAVDLADFQLFAQCMAGPEVTAPPPGCDPDGFAASDLDGDSDADAADFETLQDTFGLFDPPDFYHAEILDGYEPDRNSLQNPDRYKYIAWPFVRASHNGTRMALAYKKRTHDFENPTERTEDIKVLLAAGDPPLWTNGVQRTVLDGRILYADHLETRAIDMALTDTAFHAVAWVEQEGGWESPYSRYLIRFTHDDGKTWESPRRILDAGGPVDIDLAANDAGEIAVFAGGFWNGEVSIINPSPPPDMIPTDDKAVLITFNQGGTVSLVTVMDATGEGVKTEGFSSYSSFVDVAGGPGQVFYAAYQDLGDLSAYVFTRDPMNGNSLRSLGDGGLPHITRTIVNQIEGAAVAGAGQGIWDIPLVGAPVQRSSTSTGKWPVGSNTSPTLIATLLGGFSAEHQVSRMDGSGVNTGPFVISEPFSLPVCPLNLVPNIGDQCYEMNAYSGSSLFVQSSLGAVVGDLYYAAAVYTLFEWIPDGYNGARYYSVAQQIVISGYPYEE